jgi:hypothetical protein
MSFTYRETLYPDNFFCHPCKLYEDLISGGSLHGLANRNSHHFKCTAEHTDYLFPTQLKKQSYVIYMLLQIILQWIAQLQQQS